MKYLIKSGSLKRAAEFISQHNAHFGGAESYIEDMMRRGIAEIIKQNIAGEDCHYSTMGFTIIGESLSPDYVLLEVLVDPTVGFDSDWEEIC